MSDIKYKPIGVVRSEFKSPEQSDYYEREGEGIVELYPEYKDGLKDIEKYFSHVLVVYHMHTAKRSGMIVRPFDDPRFPEIGVFASGGPSHPNPIGITPCRILKVEGNKLYLKGLDAMDGSPVLDIKPYSPQHYTVLNPKYAGWEDEHHGKEPKDKLI
jgi:tRNA-Thr(GGU) m(6)t(6)A37 methyltransferase TsaA